ncbi:hypothetical protein VOLCADRAFT_98349 [Volvox carteri f. nagariensis]|uniref:Uncharacterized protein n=1 Tax=Volvox carteri f. nagariensis TaxID=3068 RepID=D8UF42_VOLCA|nr:uncharacterized protein VOLCADRAFT_98349 [Volvox carteri f. nagariensis]EFJ41652.1 hypothetical protein VOLCADRAFT_98349 [Volvox carteri f. nagariensis]|eukprot:XP_002957308.1 hypothetical protein VOLCADRAFT_98349 [Volvox carteri f. nagariensis]
MCPDRGLMMCLQAVVCSLSSRFIGLIMSLTLRYLTCQVLADGVSPDTAPAVHIVLLTSPKKTTMKEMRKAVAVTWYMPFWELKELLDCRSKMYSAVPEATVEELYTYYGGVARYVLEQPLKNPNWMLSKLQKPLISAIDASNVSQVLKGYLFEAVMHAALATGGKFDVLPLDPKTLERGKEEKLDIPECKQYNIFTDNEVHGMMSTKMDTYLRPKSSNFPVIDALMVPAMYLFQMTESAMKEINADDLEDVFKRLGISAPGQEGRQPSLYFVVDPSIYNKFKVRAGTKKRKACEEREAAWPPDPKKHERSANTRLYILRGCSSCSPGGSTG